jgi:hypothetical protein
MVVDAEQRAGWVDEGAAREAVMHGRRRPQHLLDRATAAGPQRTADDGDDARARGDDVAPRAADGQREVTDARDRGRRRNWRPGSAFHAQHREARRRIPAGELGVERGPVAGANVEAVFSVQRPHHRDDGVFGVDDAAGGTASALYLDNRGRGGRHGVRERV